MMNQSASAQRRPSAGSTATAGCCPMLVHPQFFVNTFSTQSPLPPPPPATQQCLLSAQATQLQLQPPSTTTTNNTTTIAPQSAPQSQALNGTNLTAPIAHNTTNIPAASVTQNGVGSTTTTSPTNGHQQQQTQAVSRQDHTNYNASLSAHSLPLHHLLAGRHSASNCMALAAALASASFHQHQQLQQAHQQQIHHHHQQQQPTPINHSQQQSTTAANTTAHATPQPLPTNANQVPILNFNSYSAAQPFLNIPAPAPLAAHLNLSNSNHQQLTTNGAAAGVRGSSAANQMSHQSSNHRPLASNTTLNSAANQQNTHQPQQQPNNYRTVPQPPIQQPTQNQTMSQQANRNILSDDALNSLFNEHFQAILVNQLLANHQFAPAAPINSTRHIPPIPSGPASVLSSNPVSTQQQQQPLSAQQQPEQANNQSVGQQQPPTFQPSAQSRMAQIPPLDTYQSQAPNAANLFQTSQQQQQANTGPVQNTNQTSGSQVNQQPQEPVPLQTQPQQQSQPQQPQPIPPLPFYSFPQVEQALALLTNPQVANNLFSHVFNIYLQGGLRTEPHHTHHHHHPQQHYYHHHLHGSHHHHHHHGPNGQNNGQDETMLTISESKPRGLNRAEIDSLTPYVQMNEKDSRTCVICLSKFELKSKIRPLPCNHAFHAKCVDKWLRANRTCPICRRDALKTYGAKIKRI